jgi:hypothetical protein
VKWLKSPVLLSILTCALAGGLWWQFGRSAAAPVAAPGTDAVSGLPMAPEVQLVLVGATFCHGADSPEFQAAVVKLKENAARIIGQRGYAYSTVGVAIDWTPAEGLEFLSRFGSFDQVLAGRNWVNEGAVKYIWRDLPGSPSVPTLLIVQRDVKLGNRIEIGAEHVLVRIEGADSITAFAQDTSFAFLAPRPTPAGGANE